MIRYPLLSDKFVLRESDSQKSLYSLKNGDNYDLTAEQLNFLLLLDGRLPLNKVIQFYDSESRGNAEDFLKNLLAIGAVDFKEERLSRPRNLLSKKVPDERLESVHLEASSECNMKCVHCYQNKYMQRKERLGFSEIISLLDQMVELQVNNVGISGGEPLLLPEVFDVMHEIEARNMRISSLFTNGLLIDDAFIDRIKSMRSDFGIFISLDSISTEGMSFRGFKKKAAKSAVEKILRSIKFLTRNNVKVILNTVVNSANIQELEEMYSLIQELNVDSWRIGFPKQTNLFKKNLKRFNVEWKVIAERCLHLLELHFDNRMPFHLQIEYLFREELFENGFPEEVSDDDFVCDYEGRRSECCIKPNGDVVSCAYCYDLPIGNIRESSLWNIWYSEKMKSVKKIRIGDVMECRNCELKSLCATGCRANAFFLHSDFNNAKDDYACQAVGFFREKVIPVLKRANFF